MVEMNEKTIEWLRLEETPSTNDLAKAKRGEGKSLFITAKKQSGGRGTKGRSFSSMEGGVYLSLLRFHENFPAKNAFSIMCSAAVAACETLAFYGAQPQIKWPNDIFVNGRKICGILIENTLSGANISSSIVGVGLNVYNPLPEELKEIATTLYLERGKRFPVEEVTERLAKALLAPPSMEKYEKYLGFVGEEVALLLGEERVPAILLGVDSEGRLRAKTKEGEKVFSSAEVSIRI